MKNIFSLAVFIFMFSTTIMSQPWLQNDAIFNPSGIPSLPFSQPRFGDMDGDEDADLIIGNINEAPLFMENIGTTTSPSFIIGENIFSDISSLDAEIGVCWDIDNDGDLDFIAGGFTGLNLFINTGTVNQPVFEKVNNFFSGLTVGTSPVPDLADVDGDGDADLVVGLSESGLVKLYSNIGTPTEAVFSENEFIEIGDVGLYAYPTFCDLDADLDKDLIVGRDGHGFIYYKNTGDIYIGQWEPDPLMFEGVGNDSYWNSPGIVDLNGDGTFDLIFGTASGPLNYYINTGTPSAPDWQVNNTLFGGVIDVGGASNPYMYDYDQDGDMDMFTGSQLGDIKYFENTGTPSGPAWEENSGAFTSLKHSIYSAVAIGDVNGDNLADAIVGDLSGHLYYHRNTGLEFTLESDALQSIALGGWSSPRLVDFDQDGDQDIVVGNEAGVVNYIENQGTATSPTWVLISGFFPSINPGTNTVPALVDLDFDEDLDMLCGNLWGEVTYYENQNGTWVENSFIMDGIETEQNTAPAFADLDDDGDPDLILGQYNGTFSYYENRNTVTSAPHGDPYPGEHPASVYPNPMISKATVKFHLQVTSNVSIHIMGSTGTSVFVQQFENLSPGDHTFQWDAESVKPGLYFILITRTEKQEILKVLKW